jgi:acyloxyacyl hydrolase
MVNIYLFLLLTCSSFLTAHAIGGTTCVACGLISALLFESKSTLELQHLFTLTELNFGAVDFLGLNPDSFCSTLKLCEPTCKLFPNKWPVTPPPAPQKDPKNVGYSLSIGVGAGDDTLNDNDNDNDNDMVTLRDAIISLVRSESESDSQKIKKNDEDFFELAAQLTRLLSPTPAHTSSSIARAAARDVFPSLQSSHPCKTSNISCLIHRLTDNHLPISDSDGDAFAPIKDRGLRGSHWRGADCDDSNIDVYPGRRVDTKNDPAVDHDCNGIYGVDNTTGNNYETQLCSGTERRGLIHIGDSATAHFHLPPQWLSKHGWGLRNLVSDGVDELDQPACAWGTGFKNFSSCPYSPNKTTNSGSIAERLWRRNACNHRDFQNVGVNGARSTAALSLIDSAARDQENDHPALVIFSLIGNDVCNGHPGTSRMTPPATFRNMVTQSLEALDKKLPKGSFVVLVGLVDGRVLFNTMHARQHPIGNTYEEVYGYLNCNTCNPCHGWLNSNETLRNETTTWAKGLNDVYRDILQKEKYQHFTMNYFNPDFAAVIEQYVAAGGDAGDVIEPSDGFHPSQTGNELFSAQLWNWLEQEFPQALGAENPNNNEIMKLFPGQGGM